MHIFRHCDAHPHTDCDCHSGAQHTVPVSISNSGRYAEASHGVPEEQHSLLVYDGYVYTCGHAYGKVHQGRLTLRVPLVHRGMPRHTRMYVPPWADTSII